MKFFVEPLKNKLGNKTKVAENYFFMTVLQVVNSAFGILIYPYLIRVLGPNQYGIYVFGMSILNYFLGLISYGFTFPGVKAISTHKEDKDYQSDVLSVIFTSKIYLSIFSTVIFVVLLATIRKLADNSVVYTICYIQVLGEILVPMWFFQGVQKMKALTIIQLSARVLSLPFIFIFVKSSSDLVVYAAISTSVVLVMSVVCMIYLRFFEQLRFRLRTISSLRSYFKDGMPFFLTSVVGVLKQESTTIIIGIFLGMRDVAIYDLANKIISIPRMLTASINGALFPDVIGRKTQGLVRRIIKYETVIGVGITIAVALLGYWIVLLLGGGKMVDAYPVALILSTTIFVWLVVGAFVSFIFVPENKYYYVTKNQVVALVSFALFATIGLLISKSVLSLAIAMALSGFCEVLFCVYIVKLKRLI